MITVIARKELKEMVRDGRFQAAAVIVLGLLLVSLGAGWKHYSDIRDQHLQAQGETREQWLNQGEKNPHSAAHYGVYAFKPKMQLSILDTGVDPYTGVAVWLEAHRQNEFKFRPAQDSTTVQRFGDMTAAAVLQLLIPLLIVMLTFAAFAGENEQGTLRQLLSLGVDRRRLALGKALGIAAGLGLVLVPAAAIGSIALMSTAWTAGGGILAGDFWRTALMAAAYLAYFGIFLAVSLAVSALAPSSRFALVVLLAFWAANGLFSARVMSDLTNFLYPTPSAVEFTVALQNDLNNPEAVAARLEQRRQELFAEYGVSDIADLPISFAGINLQESEDYSSEVFDRHFGPLSATFGRQNDLEQFGAIFSPFVAIRSISMGLAGTDYFQHAHFAAAAEVYRRDIQRIMNEDITANADAGGGAYTSGADLWEKVPEFEYRAPEIGWVLGNYRQSIAILLLWLLATTFLGAAAATAVRVR